MGLKAQAATPPSEPGRNHNISRSLAVDGFTASLLFTLAAAYLPRLSLPLPLSGSDLHDACCAAAVFLGAKDRLHAHRLADAAESRLTAYLLKSGQVVCEPCDRCILRNWLVGTDVHLVVRELQRAANHYRLLHAATIFDGQALRAFMLGQIPPHTPGPLPSEAA